MKKFALVLVLAFTFALTPFSLEKAEAYYTSYNNCYAYTVCPQGFTISCNVWGDVRTGTVCTWAVVPYTSVACNGFDAYGQWVNFFYSCY